MVNLRPSESGRIRLGPGRQRAGVYEKMTTLKDHRKRPLVDTRREPVLRNGPRPMCIHVSVPKSDTIWLPPDNRDITKAPMQRRLYCMDCGRIKRKGTDGPKKIGFWINIISEKVEAYIARERRRGVNVPRITDVQKRLIVQHLEEDDLFMDFYDSSKTLQLERLNQILLQHSVSIPPRVLRKLTDI